jgi:hypothetical protein
MKPLYIEKSKVAPQVIFDKSNGIFLIKGRSLPENPFSFFEPMLDWVKEYIINPNQITVFTFEFEYFNSASSKVILEILRLLEKLLSKGLEVRVNWCYMEEDEDVLETGQIYSSLVDVPFIFNGIARNY